MNAHAPIEHDELACGLDDQISHLIRSIMLQAQEIAEHPDQGAFDRLVDQQTRVADAFNAGRRLIVAACERRSQEKLNRAMTFARAS